ncbi:hypothetical protein Glove_11g61 [Diversispora epigaea]|uniref:Uncharacterized protein n=1 Tax=Diversispora epigaea TaxID=1348612 RepID=A0A397JQ24_9GLOM|nr:hypothetical protein Glove_11g61 [Diversispora epigaea]
MDSLHICVNHQIHHHLTWRLYLDVKKRIQSLVLLDSVCMNDHLRHPYLRKLVIRTTKSEARSHTGVGNSFCPIYRKDVERIYLGG